MHRRWSTFVSLLVLVSMSIGCSTKPSPSDETSDTSAPHKSSSWFGRKEVTVPAASPCALRMR